MKPQQILNKLAKYNEVQKVELSAEEPIKVEFALADDLKKVIQVSWQSKMKRQMLWLTLKSIQKINQAIQLIQDDAKIADANRCFCRLTC